MVVSGSNRPKHRWTLNGHEIEQSAFLKYLGITFRELSPGRHILKISEVQKGCSVSESFFKKWR